MLVLCALTVAVFAVVFAVFIVIVGSVAVYELFSGAASSLSSAVVITTLGGDIVRVAISAFRAIVLNAAIMVFMAIMFMFKLDMFSCHFFFWLRLPCPGPGMLGGRTE